MSDNIELPRDIVEKLANDPNYLKRAISSNAREAFKDKFGVSKASGLRCPACSQYGTSGGSLWWNPEVPTYFACRKCERVWTINCLTEPNEDVIKEIKGK